MKKNIFAILLIALVTAGLLSIWHLYYRPAYPLTSIAPERPLTQQVLLVPLDGRPPCRQFVIDAGKIAGIDVMTPPSALQDYYSLPGDTQGMRDWLRQSIAGKDAAILSIDQLLYGGLLAAREKEATPAEIQALIQSLRELHAAHPEVPLYAFSILPRQTPQDSIDGLEDKKNLLAYSRLKGREAAGIAIDEAELQELTAKIDPEILRTYLHHFEENEALNQQLIGLVKEGVLQRLVLGQDDGEPYSIPNIEKSHLTETIRNDRLDRTRVALTHGADEIALTLLANLYQEQNDLHPTVCVQYGDPAAGARVMPFMAVSVEETVREKLQLIGAKRTNQPEDADFILYVAANDEQSLPYRAQMLHDLQKARSSGQPVALVDLSEHFSAQETLLPLLIRHDYPLNSLIAYAGWNTTSNAIGTATAQGALYILAKERAQSKEEAIGIVASNLEFLHNRILEDYFYLKEDIDIINQTLQKAGYRNTADLDLEHNYQWATAMLQASMDKHLAVYKNTQAIRTPVTFTSPAGDFTLETENIKADVSFPWPRTFEIYLHTTLSLAQEN